MIAALLGFLASLLGISISTAAILLSIALALVLWLLLWTPAGKHLFQILITNIVGAAVAVAAPIVHTLSGDLDLVVKAVIAAFNANGPNLIKDMEAPLADVAKNGFKHVTRNVAGKGHTAPDRWQEAAADAIADAAGFGLASYGVTAAFESLFPEKLNTLNGIGPMLATLAGFEEVTKAALGPLFAGAIAAPAKYDTQFKMRPNLLAEQIAVNLFSRRIISRAEAFTFLRYAGYQDPHIEHLLAGGYRPVSPFVLARLADGPDWDPAAMRRLLEYSGYRPQDIDLLIKAFEAQALRALRQQYLTAAMASFEAGLSSNQDLDNVIKDLNISPEAEVLIKKIAGLKKSDAVFKEHLAAEKTAVNGDVIPVSLYRENLLGLGLAPETADGLADQAQRHQDSQEAAAQRREAATLFRQERQLYIQDWLAAYKAGDVNEVELTAGLIAIGLPLVVVAEYVALARFRKKPPKTPKAKAAK